MKKRLTAISFLLGALLLPFAMDASAGCTVDLSGNGVRIDDQFSFPMPNYTSPFWESTRVYNQGQIVRHYDGHQYEARWWNQGMMPGSDAGEVWKMTIGFNGKPQKWEPNQVYYGGEQTDYQNRRYTAKWWIKGEVPGTGNGWSAGEILDPLVLVKLSGNYKRETCTTSTGQLETTYTLNWAITEGQSTVAYWKIMEEDAYRPVEMWVELARGTTKSGTVVYKGNSLGKRSYAHLCTSSNVCRRVLAMDRNFN